MASRSLGTTETEAVVEQSRSLVPSIYVFGDSIVDVGNNDFLPPPAPRARFPYGIDFAGTGMTGRFTNGYNLADLVGIYLFTIYVCMLIFCYMWIFFTEAKETPL